LNAIVAEKTEDATDKQTRNSSGKTSIAWIVHHLLGASCGKKSIFKSDSLIDHHFEMCFDLESQKVKAWRFGNAASKIFTDSNLPDWPVQPKVDKTSGDTFLSTANWTSCLGSSMFGLPEKEKFGPTFRACIPYFVRREWDGGFAKPENAYKGMNAWGQQVNLSFLLGLDWKNPQKLQTIRDNEGTIKALKKGRKNGVLPQFVGRTGELKTRLAVAEKQYCDLQNQLEAFEVLPEYRELEQEASNLAIKVSEAANQIAVNRQRVLQLETQLQDEIPIDKEGLEKLYQEANIILPDLVRQRLDAVQQFHERVLKNRVSHLTSTLQQIESEIIELESSRGGWDKRRIEILTILDSRGAIDQLQKLEAERIRLGGDVEELRRRLSTAVEIDESEAKMTIERGQVQQATFADHREHESLIRESILIFEEFSKTISDHEGSLTVDVTDNGPQFSVEVEGGRSVGIRNMQVFCFDLMLSVLWSKQGLGPGFLFHDSHLFDGVDSRQVASAIQLGQRVAESNGFQYIFTINSDAIPWDEFDPEFDFRSFVNPVQLTDESDDGGLFGIRI
jgi:uncharacterized protein YydD (DUF2326 family)